MSKIASKPLFPWLELSKYKERVSICKECPHYKVGVCTKCGCPILSKAILAHTDCPVGRWDSINENIEKENTSLDAPKDWGPKYWDNI